MGLKDKSAVVSILLGVLFASIAVSMLAYVALTGNQNLRIYLVTTALGIFVTIGLIVMKILENRKEIEEAHKERAQVIAKGCPNFWSRTWDPCTESYVCSPMYDLPDGTTIKMRPGTQMNDLNLAVYNQEPANTRCNAILSQGATFPFVEMINRCHASGNTLD